MFKLPCVAACSWGSGRLDVFGLGPDYRLYHRYWDNQAATWGPGIGPELISGSSRTFLNQPAAVCWGANRIDVFCVGGDYQMYHIYSQNSAPWAPTTGPESLGGSFTSAPAAVSWGPDRLDVFAVGSDGTMYHRYWDNTAAKWEPASGWEQMGTRQFQGWSTYMPSAISRGPNQIDVFAVGTDGKMYYRYYNTSSPDWQPAADWQSLDGLCESSPAAVVGGPGAVSVFCLSNDLQMYCRYLDGKTNNWLPANGWLPLGGTFNSTPSAVTWGQGRIDVFGLGIDNQLLHKSFSSNNWSPSQQNWDALAGGFHSSPAAVAWGSGRLDVFALGDDNGMWWLYYANGAWNTQSGIGGWQSVGGKYQVIPDPTHYTIIPIVWQPLFPNGVEKNWQVTPYTAQDFFNNLTTVVNSSYFGRLGQYGVAKVSLQSLININDPLPPGSGTYTTDLTTVGIQNMLQSKLANGTIPLPSGVATGTPVYTVILPAGATVIDRSADNGYHQFFTYPNPPQSSTGSQLVLWAWAYGDSTVNGAMGTATHEIIETIGADAGAPGELCDECGNNSNVGKNGISVAVYLDAQQNACVAPPDYSGAVPAGG